MVILKKIPIEVMQKRRERNQSKLIQNTYTETHKHTKKKANGEKWKKATKSQK
jgi:hypothetical protein